MILTVDAGNTNIAIGLFSRGILKSHWRLSSRTHRTADELFLYLRDLFLVDGVAPAEVTAAVMCSVVPDLTMAIRDGVARFLSVSPIVVSHDIPLPVGFEIDDPSQIGGDLIANAIGGYERAKAACVVVDFGTALSFTAVDENGRIQGVAIAPGVGTAVRGLVDRTAALPMVDLTWTERFIGRNTGESLRSGILHGYSGLVDRIAGGMVDELGGKARVIATGGEGALLADHCSVVSGYEPWLTLQGLHAVGMYTQST